MFIAVRSSSKLLPGSREREELGGNAVPIAEGVLRVPAFRICRAENSIPLEAFSLALFRRTRKRRAGKRETAKIS